MRRAGRGKREGGRERETERERKRQRGGRNLIDFFVERERILAIFFPFFDVWFYILVNPVSDLGEEERSNIILGEGKKRKEKKRKEKEKKRKEKKRKEKKRKEKKRKEKKRKKKEKNFHMFSKFFMIFLEKGRAFGPSLTLHQEIKGRRGER